MIKETKLVVLSFVITILFFTTVSAQKLNQLNANGKRTGIWQKNYDNGDIRYKGQFKNGKEVGTFSFYKEGSPYPVIVKVFSAVSDTATVKFYSKSRVKTKGKMIGKKRIGKWIYYFSDGKRLFSEENYADGKLNGLLKNYYSNGKLTEVSEYKNGKKHGNSKIYTEDGILIEDVNYVTGVLSGEAKYFDLKGVIKEKGLYENGNRKGKWEYYIDGEVSEKGRPKNNMLKKDKIENN